MKNFTSFANCLSPIIVFCCPVACPEKTHLHVPPAIVSIAIHHFIYQNHTKQLSLPHWHDVVPGGINFPGNGLCEQV